MPRPDKQSAFRCPSQQRPCQRIHHSPEEPDLSRADYSPNYCGQMATGSVVGVENKTIVLTPQQKDPDKSSCTDSIELHAASFLHKTTTSIFFVKLSLTIIALSARSSSVALSRDSSLTIT